MNVALSSVYKANAARRPTVHHVTVPEFCCRGSANRCDLAEMGVRTLPENNREMPHLVQPMMRRNS
jgi:hypothetical protein